jgi:hypothetical protein
MLLRSKANDAKILLCVQDDKKPSRRHTAEGCKFLLYLAYY